MTAGSLLDNADNKQIPSPRHKAMDLLARREHSVAELRTKLRVREYPEADIELAIESLVRDSLLSDDRFAAAFVSSRVRKGQGPVRIRGELRQRGVADHLIEAHLAAADVDWLALAREVRNRKFGSESAADFREQARQSRFLQHRGFSSEQIRAAMGDPEY